MKNPDITLTKETETTAKFTAVTAKAKKAFKAFPSNPCIVNSDIQNIHNIHILALSHNLSIDAEYRWIVPTKHNMSKS